MIPTPNHPPVKPRLRTEPRGDGGFQGAPGVFDSTLEPLGSSSRLLGGVETDEFRGDSFQEPPFFDAFGGLTWP